MKTSSDPALTRGLSLATVLLLAVSVASCLLALFQWMELLVVSSGGSAICGVNSTVNCEVVWTSAVAKRIHGLTQVPVAGLGLIWGLVAFALSLLLTHRQLSGGSLRVPVVALRLTAAIGVLSCITFAVASVRLGAVCLTCLGTYALTLAFGLVAWRLLPGKVEPGAGELTPALAWAAGFAAVAYLLVLGPGIATKAAGGVDRVFPVAQKGGAATQEPGAGAGDRGLEQYLLGLPEAEQRAVSESLAIFRDSPTPDVSRYATRERYGPADAPLKIVEFTDIRCGHCAQLVRTLGELKASLPPGRISVEARHFPLASECNGLVPRTDPTGVACAGAKAQICLEGTPEYQSVQEKLFEEQASLTAERVIEIASRGSMPPDKLTACMDSPETRKKLEDDIAYAAQYKPRGTPLVLLNGKEGTPVGAFLYAMAMTGGDASAPVFQKLPPPPRRAAP